MNCTNQVVELPPNEPTYAPDALVWAKIRHEVLHTKVIAAHYLWGKWYYELAGTNVHFTEDYLFATRQELVAHFQPSAA